MLSSVTSGGGNLLLNIGPDPEGNVPREAEEPLKTVGRWLEKNGEAVYGKVDRSSCGLCSSACATSVKGRTLYLWNWIWPTDGEIVLGGFKSKVRSVRLLEGNVPMAFEQKGWQIFLRKLPKQVPDTVAGVTVLAVEFEEELAFTAFATVPALNGGREF
jgi:alpha-L-fucosidase